MDAKLAKKLPAAAKSVVSEAMRSGAFDKGELTMGEARRLVALKMGLEEDALDSAKDIRKQVKEAITEAIDEDASDEPESPVKARKGKVMRNSDVQSSAASSPAKPAKKTTSKKSVESDEESEADEAAPPSPASSAMSSVYDEPPKPKRSKAAPKASKGRTKKDPNEEIRHVQDILRDLGMKGNPTLGKAKSLKARRELAQELSDVREYEQGHGLSADRPSRTRAGRGTRDSAPPAPDEDGATAAVMDFLGDDSD
ncbi:hypothetical protein A1Q1_04888 [Trichosporon asahii var. asahii CBS 2479]|uniref:Histone chaperone domain-containing protein n=1 Tax=Trichosporon asahii var. asahii (strain ATCC 90039 / CBS 2479 / JCM 2466 / KCTC 7840 / NBRC 103889/ NCYC 2677 / UAMH 7654) TaxID=1186058 RepID=J5SMZ1_TRIAS|nr:hypothetical protein A1Q1_04888 [Trichosporon asahii var. asahii CBS 2479]EJT46521.1 hypothetical protein A1Q1_04888 [Trichosporon asahii var. asahii CBS 2479]